MNLDRLYAILKETTREFRKGAVVEGTPALVAALIDPADVPPAEMPGGVAEIYMMPHVSEADEFGAYEMVDCEFLTIGVDKAKAEQRRDELVAILKTYPQPERLAGGPSYIEVGGVLGDQSAAFCLFALGKVLGLWGLITPAALGITGAEAREMAGSGFVMITGFAPERDAA
jgi:hypothetical protein